MPSDKEYHRKYNRERYQRLRAEAIEKLGGKCAHCATTSALEFDHIDPSQKSFGLWMNVSLADFWNEIAKCQLLCRSCHNSKTLKDNGQKSAREVHGTVSSYRYCHCELCRKAKNEYLKEYRKHHPRRS